jgi:hypothetical protein
MASFRESTILQESSKGARFLPPGLSGPEPASQPAAKPYGLVSTTEAIARRAAEGPRGGKFGGEGGGTKTLGGSGAIDTNAASVPLALPSTLVLRNKRGDPSALCVSLTPSASFILKRPTIGRVLTQRSTI